MSEGEAALRAILETLDPKTRNDLRRVLIHEQAARDAIVALPISLHHRRVRGQGGYGAELTDGR